MEDDEKEMMEETVKNCKQESHLESFKMKDNHISEDQILQIYAETKNDDQNMSLFTKIKNVASNSKPLFSYDAKTLLKLE